MHITILSSLLLLPLVMVTEGLRWRPPTWPPPTQAPYYLGDMLNITKCYCDGVNGDTKKGHYHRFDYRNFYNEQVYSLDWTCNSDTSVLVGWESTGLFSIPDCWNMHDSFRDQKKKQCMRSYNADTFCFELGYKFDPHDYYYFNKQKRGLPDYGIHESTPDECVALCRDMVGGKIVANDVEGGWNKSWPSLDHNLTTVRSSFQSYTNLDDIDANY